MGMSRNAALEFLGEVVWDLQHLPPNPNQDEIDRVANKISRQIREWLPPQGEEVQTVLIPCVMTPTGAWVAGADSDSSWEQDTFDCVERMSDKGLANYRITAIEVDIPVPKQHEVTAFVAR